MSRLVIFTSLPKVGGHSTLTFGLCRMLRSHFDEIEVWCKTMPEHGHSPAVTAKIEELGCKVILVSDETGKINNAVLAKAVWEARKKKTDVFFTLAMRHLSVALAVLVGAPNSIYYHITHDLNEGTIKRLGFYAKIFKQLVFICPATYEEFPGATGNPRFTWVAQSSEIPVKEPEKLPAERAQRLVSADQPIRFGLLGRLTKEKGSEAMVEYVDSTSTPCELHVAGSGPFAEAFKERESAGRPAVVKFYGAYDPSERETFLRKVFAGIDYLLVPSQDEWETLSMATLESLQHGVPAVLCRTGGLKSFGYPQLGPASEDVVRLIAPGDLVTTLNDLASRPRRPQAVEECLSYYEKYFSDPVVLERWLSVLKKH